MNANDVIEAYVTDVAVQLPRKQRNDVAFELRALLNEELQARAEAAGRAIDAPMALELVRAFGRPADVAARYRPALTIIDPADGQAFLRAAVIGLGIIWSLGLVARLRQPIDSGWGFLTALGQWWGSTLVSSLWWPGLLVVVFGVGAWIRSKRPGTSEWKPRAGDRGPESRAATAMGLAGLLCGLFVLIDPRWLLDAVSGGRAAPAAYQAFAYADAFRQRQGPWLIALILLNVPLMIAVLVNGRWSATMRRLKEGLGLLTCTTLAWAVLDGPVFVTPAVDRATKAVLALIVAVALVSMGVAMYRRVRPAPNPQIRT
jgi:hypothetical protein